MPSPRFYCPQPLTQGAEIDLPDAVRRHAITVLRLRTGDGLVLFDGGGGEHQARLIAADKRRARVLLTDYSLREAESPLQVTLGQALAKGERMDYLLQKATELGVYAVAPLLTERSVARPGAESRSAAKQAHWRGVMAGSCAQCRRNTLPRLSHPQPLADWLQAADQPLKLVLAPDADTGLNDLEPADRVALLVGPEGGLSEAEIAQATAAGFRPLRLGPRVLRTETAGVAALAALQALWGDLR